MESVTGKNQSLISCTSRPYDYDTSVMSVIMEMQHYEYQSVIK